MTDYRAFRDNDVMVSLDEWEIKGAVYIARSRVAARLKEELKTLEADDVL